MSVKSLVLKASTVVAGIAAVLFVAAEPHHPTHVERQSWSFQGFFGDYDRAQIRRGFQVYYEVCAACHSMDLVSYRSLQEVGFTEDEVKAIAATVEVTDGPDDMGEMFDRPGRPSDRFKAPYANEQAARASNNGAFPPDLSLIAKARGGKGFTGYEGADYIYSLMTGYEDAPEGVTLNTGMSYNTAFKGHQIAMPQPINDDSVTYPDGTPATLEQQSRDVALFLTWAAEGNLEDRHRTGIKALIFLTIFTLVAYAAKRKIWAKIH